jgi:hypothetical protein
MKIPKEGSKWQGNESTVFIVLHIIELEEHVWVHYRKEGNDHEYSCYLESFLQRFREILT